MTTATHSRTCVLISIVLLAQSILSGQANDCNTPIVGKGAVVDDISGDLAALLAFDPEWQNAIDGDLTNFTTIELTNVTGIGDVSIISIKYAEQTISAGRRAGFVIDIDNTLGGLLGADVLNSLEINSYLDNVLQETASVGGGGPAISLNLVGGQGSKRRVDFLTTEDFDELELVFTGVATSTLLSEFQIYYAYHMEDGCDHNCVTALTTVNFGGLTATSDCTGLLCGATDFPDPPANVIDGDTTNFNSGTILVLGTAWIEINIGQDIPAGYDVGFAVSNEGLLGLLSAQVLDAITITTFDNGIEQDEFVFDDLLNANVGVLTGDVNLVSFTTTEAFDEVRITFGGLSVLNNWRVYYGFIRPDSDLDGFMDCVDACEDGDDNFDMDGDGIPDDCDDSCVVTAGVDQLVCTDGTTAQLNAAPSGFTWSAVPGNPSAASVHATSGAVTGLDAEGTYLFALSNGVCMDTVGINYFEALGSTECNNPIAGPGVIIDNEPNEVINDANVIDGDLSNYASDSDFVGLLIGLGGGNDLDIISVKDTVNSYPAGTRVGFVVSFPSGLSEVNLFDAIAIRTYLNNVEVETSILGGSSVADADALGLFGQQRISIVATGAFDEVELVAVGGIITAELSLINELRVYYAFTEPTTCPGGDGSFGSEGCETVLNCESSYAATLNFDTTGIQGAACALCDLNSLSHLIDADLSNFATLDLDVNLLVEGNVSVVLNEPAPAGTIAGFAIRLGGGLVGAGVLSAFELNTYLSGVLQESVDTDDPLVTATVLFADSDLTYFSFTTTEDFDEIQFVVDADVLGNALLGGEIDIFYGFVDFDEDGDGVPDCRDKCCLGNDNLDEDGDGVPDACDDGPDAVNDTITLTEDMQFDVDVLANDDFGGDGPGGDSIDIVTPPLHGTAVIDDNGTPNDPTDDSILYTPDPNFTGEDSLRYAICDSDMDCDSAWVFFTVEPVNDPPVAIDDINVTPQGEPASGNVLTNDEDPDGDALMVTETLDEPVNGTLTLNPDGSYTYTPNGPFTGQDQFSYVVCDNGTPTLCDTAVVYINVIGDPATGNLPPVANPDANQTEEDTPIMGDLLANDDDPNGDNLVINTTPVQDPDNGMVVINPDGTYTYTPDMGFVGQDTFYYEVCDDAMTPLCATTIVVITVLPDEGNSTFAHDDAAVTNEDTQVNGNVSANDFDPEGDAQMVNTTQVTGPANGMVVLLANGSYTYTPNAGFVGNDFFTYETCDDETPSVCDTATVSIAVLPVNDPPIAIDDINNTPQDEPASGNVLTNDEDPDGDVLTVTETLVEPTDGMVVLNPDGSYTYTPDPLFTGQDQFTYVVCDDGTPVLCDTAVVYINVIGDPETGNLPPVANPDANQTEEDTPISGDLLSNDSDPNGDNLVINTTPVEDPDNGMVAINPDGTYTYTPDMGFVGQDTFFYEVCDDVMPSLCSEAIVVIIVLPNEGNSTFAHDDAAVTSVNTPVDGELSQNDFDPEGDVQTVNMTPVTGPSNGIVDIHPDGTYTYTPDSGFTGNDFFTYETCDDNDMEVCDTATVYIAVIRRCVKIKAWVYLEGSLVDDQGLGIYGSEMRTDLNDLRILPGQLAEDIFLGNTYTKPLGSVNQVYNVDPWNYAGDEGSFYDSDSIPANADAGYPSTVTDWVLVSLRIDPEDGDEKLCQRAALLHKDGTIEFVDDGNCCELDMSKAYYLVIEHRNHLIIMSDTAISLNQDTIEHDFRSHQSYDEDIFMAGLVGQKEVEPDVFVMYAGNCDQSSAGAADTDIGSNDFNRWDSEKNQIGLYLLGDIDMNGDVNSNDFNLWDVNKNTLTSVIRN